MMGRRQAAGAASGAGAEAATGEGAVAASASLGRLAGSAVRVAGILATVVSALAAAYKGLSLFGSSTLKSREHLREFNGKIGAAFARLDAQQIHLSIREGHATANTTVALADAMVELKESGQANREAMMTLVNFGATIAAKIVAFVNRINEATSIIIPIAKAIEGNTRKPVDDDQLPPATLLRHLSSGKTVDPRPMRPL